MFDAGKRNIPLLKAVIGYSVNPLSYVRKELVLNQRGQTSDCEGEGEREMPARLLVCRMVNLFIFSKVGSRDKLGLTMAPGKTTALLGLLWL